MNRIATTLPFAVAAALLGACSGSTDLTATPANAGNAPASITFTNAVVSVSNRNNGDYQRTGKMDVVDRDGRAVPDGTAIDLVLLDTVLIHDNTGALAAGSLDVLSRAAGSPSLITTRCAAVTGREASNCNAGASTDFTSAVVRGNSSRVIQPGDFVVLRNADPQDRFRRVISVLNQNQIRLDRTVSRSYTNLEFWVGTAASGFNIGSFSGGSFVAGRASTQRGEAEFLVTYPANAQSLNYGCFGYRGDGSASVTDLRDSVPQSRQVLLAATAPNGFTGVSVGDFCGIAIASGTTTAQPANFSLAPGASQDVLISGQDGGQVALAYGSYLCAQTGGPNNVQIDGGSSTLVRADVGGDAIITISRDTATSDADQSATFSCDNLLDPSDTQAVITVSLPANPPPPAP